MLHRLYPEQAAIRTGTSLAVVDEVIELFRNDEVCGCTQERLLDFTVSANDTCAAVG